MKKFPSLKYPNDPETDGLLDDDVVVTEKLDGCLPYGQRVATEDGAIPIGRIVNEELDVRVKSYDGDGIVYREIEDYFKNGKADTWIRISFDSKKSSFIDLTPNHEVYTTGGKKQAGDIGVGDKLVTEKPKVNGMVSDMIVGSLLGDASIVNHGERKNSHIEETHGERQHGYAEFKMSVLGEVVNNSYTEMSAYDDERTETKKLSYQTKSIKSIDEFTEQFISGGRKVVPEDIEISDRSLAILYGDDGSCSFSELQRPRATIHTQGFTKDGAKRLLDSIGIGGRVVDYGSGPIIEFTSDGTEVLFERVAPWLPSCMSYKVSDEFWADVCLWEQASYDRDTFEVTDVSETERRNDTKYDIEVSGTHNYFTKGVLVSNSNFRFKFGEDTWIGTRNHSYRIDDENIPKAFHHAVEWVEGLSDEVKDTLRGCGTFFGESMHLHSIEYDVEYENPSSGSPYFKSEPSVVLYDWYREDSSVEQTNGWANWSAFKDITGTLDLPTTRVIAKGSPEFMEENDAFEVPEESMFGGNPEGIVVRRLDGSVRAKKVTEDFKEKNAQAFNDPSKAQSDAAEFVAMFVTSARIEKNAHKLVDEGDYDKLEMSMMEELPGRVIQDIMAEEGWNLMCDEYGFEAEFDSEFKSQVRSRTSKQCARVLKQELQSF